METPSPWRTYVNGGQMPALRGAVTCARRNDSLGITYQNLIKRGKKPKVALTAVMRKLVILANTLIAENRSWSPQQPQKG